MTQVRALEILRSFIATVEPADDYAALHIKQAENALNYLENWCIQTTEP